MYFRKAWLALCLLAPLSVPPAQAAPAASPAAAGSAPQMQMHAAAMPAASEAQAGDRVTYHKQSDSLDVQVKDVSLTWVLRVISLKSGVQILMDPAANRKTTITMKDVPLDVALKRLARGLNYSFVYDSGKKHAKSPLLVSMSILPSGKQDSAYMQPVVSPMQTAMQHVGEHGGGGLSGKRFRAFLAKMSAARRKALEQEAARAKKDQAKQQAIKSAHKQRMQQIRQAINMRRQKMMNDMKANNPSLYQARMQQQQQIMNQVMQENQQQTQQPAGK